MVTIMTGDERRRALDRALEIRRQRSDIRQHLKTGALGIDGFLELADRNYQAAADMRVEYLIRSMPGYAKKRTQQLMKSLHISAGRRVRGLGHVQREGLIKALGVDAVSRSSEQARRRIKRLSVLVAVLIALLGCIIVFLCFCLMELFISIITGCLFSWVFPSLATAMVILTYIALAIVRGGSCE